MTKIALTIAGSDSGGGAGVQADLRTFAFHKIHGTSAITCVTAQNTVGVTDVAAITPKLVQAQLAAIFDDMSVDAVKTGMLLNQEIIEAVAKFIRERNVHPLVVDPVMVSRAGVQLIDDSAVISLKTSLLPQATIITPNLYEARILSNQEINTVEEMKQAAVTIQKQLGVPVVLIKGGGLSDRYQSPDVWFDGHNGEILTGERIVTKNTHGTGCTLSSAIAANLALGKDLLTAVKEAKHYVTVALQNSLDIGQGNGPVGHFFPLLL
ncbi:Hydroxymethylpyrimidine/phosphomethylpyrimidine kinase [Hyella patelloides LEGE 07179]|uniref:Hydroxymethylpyrimidine/phosphomethylpyrimidine kinase n=1 Tax=Hyella patelloides LEGE 07179 TaxID=945734 RepID=A0A563VUE7_9CYAN|nr:bifunctional hydroxymethylpyrimidine kinase/phosphomethylpyrimidine kinase [Hyella patelloides]VEP15009.1 Hydroxymethylpyrimidine/phosphomethylpyrimidine kinase [Hyella patelloides LEGE 07179]